MSRLKDFLKVSLSTPFRQLEQSQNEKEKIVSIKTNFLRKFVNACLDLQEKEANSLRINILNSLDVPENYLHGWNKFRYIMLSLSERKPFQLCFGLLSWIYLFVYFILKMTVLI